MEGSVNHLVNSEDSKCFVVTAGHELPSGRRVRDVDDGGGVVEVNVDGSLQVSHVERVHVEVLLSYI